MVILPEPCPTCKGEIGNCPACSGIGFRVIWDDRPDFEDGE